MVLMSHCTSNGATPHVKHGSVRRWDTTLAGKSMLSKLMIHVLAQFMPGGDLGSALRRDLAENGDGAKRRLGWYSRGRIVLLCVARGLVYLHDQRVRP